MIYLLGLLACNEPEGFKLYNSDPTADIYSHESPLQVEEGTVLTFVAALSDDKPVEDLIAEWSRIDSNNQSINLCPPSSPDENGDSSCEIEILEDTIQIKVLVRDPQNAIGYDVVNIEAIPTSTPEVYINEPIAGNIYYVDIPILFHATVNDNEDVPEAIFLDWESNIDGDLDISGNADNEGNYSSTTNLTEGEHLITVTATDSHGKTSDDSVTITVGPSNTPPECEILMPNDNSYGAMGESVVFVGSVSDADVPSSYLIADWSSSLDGSMAEDLVPSGGSATVITSDLSLGTHEITLHVVDEVGGECFDTIIYTIETPSIHIILPNDGDRFNEGTSVAFEGSVIDPMGPQNVVIEWTSSLDGMINNASPSTAGSLYFSKSELSAGTHVLTLEGTNPDGFSNQDVITFSINGRPETPIVNITSETTNSEEPPPGEPLMATVQSSDPEDGENLNYTYEWYDTDGNLVYTETTQSNTSILPTETQSDEIWTVKVVVSDQEGFESEQSESSITVVACSPTATEIPYDGVDSNCDGLEFLNDQNEDGIPDDPNENYDSDHDIDVVPAPLGLECYGELITHSDGSQFYILACDNDVYWREAERFCTDLGYDGLFTAKDNEEFQAISDFAATNESYEPNSPRLREFMWTGYTRGPDCSPMPDVQTSHPSVCMSTLSNYYWTDTNIPDAYIDASPSSYWIDSEMSAQNNLEHCTVLTLPHSSITEIGFYDLYCDYVPTGSNATWSVTHTKASGCMKRY